MPVDINAYIGNVRAMPGMNFLALALQTLQDGINSQQTTAASSSSSSTTATPVATAAYPEPVLSSPASNPGPTPPPTTIVSPSGNPIGTGKQILALTTTTSLSSIITVLQDVTSTLTQISSVTVTTVGGYVKIWPAAQLYNLAASASAQYDIQIWKGDNTGTLLFDTGPNGPNVAAGSLCTSWSIAPLVDTSPAASQLYTIYASISNNNGQMDNIQLVAENEMAA